MPQTEKLGLIMSSDGDGSSYGRSSKLMGVLKKLGISGRWVHVCLFIYFFSTLGIYSLYICHICMPNTYAHTYGSKAPTIKSSLKFRVDYDYSFKR